MASEHDPMAALAAANDTYAGNRLGNCPPPPASEMTAAEAYSRRAALCRAAGVLVLAAAPQPVLRAVQLDTVTEAITAERTFDIVPVRTSPTGETSGANVYVVGGFNMRDCTPAAAIMADALYRHGDVYAVNYGFDFDGDAEAEAIARHAEATEAGTVNFAGLSLGGVISVVAAHRVSQYGAEVPGVALIGSPFGTDSVRNWGPMIEAGIPAFLREHHLTGGPLTRVGVNMAQEKLEELRRFMRTGETSPASLPARVLRAMQRQRQQGLPDSTCIQQLDFLVRTDLEEEVATLPKGTELGFVATDRPADDTTVDVRQALKDYRSAARGRDRRVGLYPVPDGGHADPSRNPAGYNQALAAAGVVMRWPDVRAASN